LGLILGPPRILCRGTRGGRSGSRTPPSPVLDRAVCGLGPGARGTDRQGDGNGPRLARRDTVHGSPGLGFVSRGPARGSVEGFSRVRGHLSGNRVLPDLTAKFVAFRFPGCRRYSKTPSMSALALLATVDDANPYRSSATVVSSGCKLVRSMQ
jgi:hypothetical protein